MRVKRVGRLMPVAGVTLLALAALGGTAQARTDVSAGPGSGFFAGWSEVISLNQTTGEASNIYIDLNGNKVRIFGVSGHASGGCAYRGGDLIECPYVANKTIVLATLGDRVDYYNGWLPAWVDGGAGNDTIQGSGLADALFGGAGNDTIRGSSGNDFIYGGDNDDKLWGDGGSDRVYGENGADVLHTYDNLHYEIADCGAGANDKSFADGYVTPNYPIGDYVSGCEKDIRGRNS